MIADTKTKELLEKNKIFLFRYIPLCFALFFIAFMLLTHPDTAYKGVTEGLEICFGTLIPCTYPFMVLSGFFVNCGLCEMFEKIFGRSTSKIFALSGKCAGVILMSLVGGYPVGAKMTRELYENGEITLAQGQRMMMFCVNPGPAFVISTVGHAVLGSKKMGIILFVSVSASSLIMGLFSRLLFKDSAEEAAKIKASPMTLSESLIKAVSDGSKGMMNICSYVVIFSCVTAFFDVTDLSENSKTFFYAIAEVTKGSTYCRGKVPVPIIAGIIAFGGLSIACQLMPSVKALKMKGRHFLAGRVICGGLATTLCSMMMRLFPVEVEVFAFGTRPQSVSAVSVSVSVCMVLSCLLVLVGDRVKEKSIGLPTR